MKAFIPFKSDSRSGIWVGLWLMAITTLIPHQSAAEVRWEGNWIDCTHCATQPPYISAIPSVVGTLFKLRGGLLQTKYQRQTHTVHLNACNDLIKNRVDEFEKKGLVVPDFGTCVPARHPYFGINYYVNSADPSMNSIGINPYEMHLGAPWGMQPNPWLPPWAHPPTGF